MNKKTLLTVVVVALAALLLWGLRGEKEAPQVSETTEEERPQRPPAKLRDKKTKDGAATSVLVYETEQGEQEEQELNSYERSFAVMAQTLFRFANERSTKEEFIEELRKLGLRPIVAEDRQEVIEDLTIIRTQNTLPGVRYIHAQYDGDDVQSLQHLSFEIPKGPEAHQKAVDLIQKVIPLGSRLKDTDPKMAIFKQDGYVVWLKELTPEDMIGDRFNAYTTEDVGSIRVAVEREIHEHEDHDHE